MSSMSPENEVSWHAHEIDDSTLPWPVFGIQRSSLEALHNADLITAGAHFVECHAKMLATPLGELMWSGFTADKVLEARTFGDRRKVWAVNTEGMLSSFFQWPLVRAFQPSQTGIPAVVAIDKSKMKRSVFEQEYAYRLRRDVPSFDVAVTGLFIVTRC